MNTSTQTLPHQTITPLKPIITPTLIAAFVSAYLSYSSYSMMDLAYRWSNIVQGELWRLFTHMLLHGDFRHLVLNALTLAYVGTKVERIMGHWRFLAVFVTTGVWAGLFSFSGDQFLIGSSGAIFGLMGFMLAHSAREAQSLGHHDDKDKERGRLIGLIIVNLLYGFLTPGIANGAHISGLITGLLIGYYGFPISPSTSVDNVSAFDTSEEIPDSESAITIRRNASLMLFVGLALSGMGFMALYPIGLVAQYIDSIQQVGALFYYICQSVVEILTLVAALALWQNQSGKTWNRFILFTFIFSLALIVYSLRQLFFVPTDFPWPVISKILSVVALVKMLFLIVILYVQQPSKQIASISRIVLIVYFLLHMGVLIYNTQFWYYINWSALFR